MILIMNKFDIFAILAVFGGRFQKLWAIEFCSFGRFWWSFFSMNVARYDFGQPHD